MTARIVHHRAIACLWLLMLVSAPSWSAWQDMQREGRLIACIDYQAFERQRDGSRQWGGANIEVLNTVVTHAGLKLDFMENVDFESCMEMLRIGRVDVIIGLLHSKQRARDFHLIPYRSGVSQSFYRRASDGDDDAIEFIAKIQGYQRPVIMDSVWRKTRHIEVSKPSLALRMLLANRVDGVVLSTNTGERLLKLQEFKGKIRTRPLQINEDAKVYIAVTREGLGNVHIEALKRSVEQLQASGKITEIMAE